MKVPISPHNTYDYATLATALQMNCVRKGRLSLMDMLLFIQYNALLLWVPHLCQPSKKHGMVRISKTSLNLGWIFYENYFLIFMKPTYSTKNTVKRTHSYESSLGGRKDKRAHKSLADTAAATAVGVGRFAYVKYVVRFYSTAAVQVPCAWALLRLTSRKAT